MFAGFEKDTALIDAPLETAHRVVKVFTLTKYGFNCHKLTFTFFPRNRSVFILSLSVRIARRS
jgi:hypothetical protein